MQLQASAICMRKTVAKLIAFSAIIFKMNTIRLFVKANRKSLIVNIPSFVLVSLFAWLFCYPLHYYILTKQVCLFQHLSGFADHYRLSGSVIHRQLCLLLVLPLLLRLQAQEWWKWVFPLLSVCLCWCLVVSVWLLGRAWWYLLGLLEQNEINNYRI